MHGCFSFSPTKRILTDHRRNPHGKHTHTHTHTMHSHTQCIHIHTMHLSCSSLVDFDCMSLAVSDCIPVQERERGAKEDREERFNARQRQRTIHVHQCVLASVCVFVSCSSVFDFDCMSLAVSDCILVQAVKKREEKEKERRGRRGDGQRALGRALGQLLALVGSRAGGGGVH